MLNPSSRKMALSKGSSLTTTAHIQNSCAMVSGHPSKKRNSKQCVLWIIVRIYMTMDWWHGRFFSRFACFRCMAYPTFDPEPDACYGYSRITQGTPRCPWAIKRSQQRSPCTRRPQRTSISCAAGKSERNNPGSFFLGESLNWCKILKQTVWLMKPTQCSFEEPACDVGVDRLATS